MARKKKVAEVAAEEPQVKLKALRPQRQSANTWWCGNCGSGNRVGAEQDQVCGACGTPVLVD